MRVLIFIEFLLLLLHTQPADTQLSLARSGEPGLCNNRILISGTTNISTFKLFHNGTVKIRLTPARDYNNQISEEIEVHIPVNGFYSSNPILLRDFYQLMQAGTYPEIIIRFNWNHLPGMLMNKQVFNNTVSIRLAGKEKLYETTFILESCNRDRFVLLGTHALNLSDFDIEPPVKSLGLIRVDNRVIINFELVIPYELAKL